MAAHACCVAKNRPVTDNDNFAMEIPGYAIQSTIGRGGMATVYVALQESLQREVVLKVLHPKQTESPASIERFLNEVDAAAVYANTSTAFTDGAQFGMGAEIGISTQKLHARGPMALPELTSYKWVIRGAGQVRPR